MRLLCYSPTCLNFVSPNLSMSGDHIKATCPKCNHYIKFVKYSDLDTNDLANLRKWQEEQTGTVDEYKKGFIAGIKCFAWWKDGIQYVGTTGMTLKQALETIDKIMGGCHE